MNSSIFKFKEISDQFASDRNKYLINFLREASIQFVSLIGRDDELCKLYFQGALRDLERKTEAIKKELSEEIRDHHIFLSCEVLGEKNWLSKKLKQELDLFLTLSLEYSKEYEYLFLLENKIYVYMNMVDRFVNGIGEVE